MRRHSRLLGSLALSIAALSLVACGGGGGSSPGTTAGPGSPGGTNSDRFHAYFENTLGGGTLALVDPMDPANPATIAEVPSVFGAFNPIFSGDLDLMSGALNDISVDGLTFAVGAEIVEVPLQRASGGGAPSARSVTTLSGPVDDIEVTIDHSAATRTVIYTAELAGGGYVTFDQIGSTVTPEAPFPGEPVTMTGDRATGAIDGWLAFESNMLTRVDRNLVATNLAPATEAQYIDVTGDGDAFLFLGDRFASFRQSGALVDVTTMPVSMGATSPEDLAVVGADALYFPNATSGSTFQLVRALGDGSSAQITGDITGSPIFMTVTDSRVLVGYDDGTNGDQSLVSFDLNGGDMQMLETAVTGLGLSLFSFPGTTSERIAYEVTGVGVVDVMDDGTDRQVIADASLVGISIAGPLPFHSAADFDAFYVTTTLPSGNLQLEVVEPGLPATRTVLGALPMGVDQVSVTAFFSETAIVTGITNAGASSQSDVFFVDPAQANSLSQVTDTPTEFDLGLL